MTDSNDQTDKTIRVGARKPLSLQRTVEFGHVRQNFSHGRSKSVVVEKKKTRKLGPGSEGAEAAPAAAPSRRSAPAAKAATGAASAVGTRRRASRKDGLFPTRSGPRANVRLPPRGPRMPSRVDAETVRFEPVRHAEPQPRSEVAQPVKRNQPLPVRRQRPPLLRLQQPAPVARDSAPRESRERRDAGPGAPREGGARPPFQRAPARPAGNTYMPREAGRPREIEFPQPARRGAAPADATTIEKPTRPVRPVVARQQPEEDDSRKRGPGGVKVPRPAVKLNDDGRQRQKLTINKLRSRSAGSFARFAEAQARKRKTQGDGYLSSLARRSRAR